MIFLFLLIAIAASKLTPYRSEAIVPSQADSLCSVKMDADILVESCDSGTVTIASTLDVLQNSNYSPVLQIDYTSEIRDVQLGSKYISLVNEDGTLLSVVKKSDMLMYNFRLEPQTSPSARLESGYFTPLYTVLLIENRGERFIQVHNWQQSLIATIDTQIASEKFTVFDSVNVDRLFRVFCVRQIGEQQLLSRLTLQYNETADIQT